jgi:hypothetical protein
MNGHLYAKYCSNHVSVGNVQIISLDPLDLIRGWMVGDPEILQTCTKKYNERTRNAR